MIEACTSRELAEKVNRFAAVSADGQPVRWALHWLYGTKLKSTVQGYELMMQLCERAAKSGVSIYLYGSSEETLAALKTNLQKAYPGLIVAGIESPPFRPLTAEEDAAMVERVNASGAGLVFIGLGCPKQDHFAAEHVDRIRGSAVVRRGRVRFSGRHEADGAAVDAAFGHWPGSSGCRRSRNACGSGIS